MGWWTRGPIIGRGSSATVSLATTDSGELLAVKSTDLSSSSLLQKEKCLISQLSSPYIVKYIGCDITTENDKPMYNLLMEYVPGGTLSDRIKKQGGSLEESTIRIFANQILQGLDYLHLNGIVHCDIKGQNVLIGKDGAKIGDLGCARKVEEGYGMAGNSIISGTPVFMAPEVARGEEQGFAADVWALGCTIIEMATGGNPWPDMNDPVSALYRIGYSGNVPEFPWWLSNSAKQFLSKCLERDAKERWTSKELLQHPFFHGIGEEKEAEFVRNSPTSVLYQGLWNSMEVAESSNYSPHIGSSLGSSADRIKNLIGDLVSSNSNFPSWTEDGDWITVRGTNSQEMPQISEQSQNSEDHNSQLAMDPFLYSIGIEEELESSVAIDDVLINCLVDEISNEGNVSTRLNLTLSCFNAKEASDFVLIILDFEIKITEIWFLIILIFLKAAIFLCFLHFNVFDNVSLPINLIPSFLLALGDPSSHIKL